ncbi:MAG: hypothetical protein WD894_10225 [Pirellulales bacterium]
MARHGAREQKRLAKKKAKRAVEKRDLARRSSDNPVVRFRDADRWPIVELLIPEDIWSQGIGELVISRRTPEGMIAIGVFLVDVFCLGVKDAFWRIVSPPEYRTLVEKLEELGPMNKVAPEYFSKLVHCAADYAQSLGFPPHRDFRHVRLLLEGIDPSQCTEDFECGKDGVPYYFRGPNESIADARAIGRRVEAAGGHYVIRVDSPGGGY